MTLLRALVVAVLGLALCAAPAFGHATIVRTSPADTSVLKTAPRTVQMRWSEPVELNKGSVRLLDAAGNEVPGASAKRGSDPATAELTVPSGLKNGTYVVAWKVTSADSHPVSGAFSFSIGAPSAAVTVGAAGPNRFVEALDAISRGIAFLGLAFALGGACVLVLLWPAGPASRRGRRFVWTGVGMLAGGTLAVLLLQGPYAGASLGFTLSTRFGQALAIRLVLTGVFAWLVWRALAARAAAAEDSRPAVEGSPAAAAPGDSPPAAAAPDDSPPAVAPLAAVPRGLLLGAAACALGLLVTWTLTDHSRTGVQTWLGVPAATVHLAAMALWFGGLALLLVGVLRRPDASLAPVLPRFSALALACFVALGVTGVYLAWRQTGALAALPATDFGKLLLVKSGVVLAIIAIASISRRALARRATLRRTVLAEVGLGVVVLGLTATLVNAEPARVAYAPPFDVTVPGPQGGTVQLHMEPAKQGSNVVDIYLKAKDGLLIVPPEVTARLAPPDGENIGPLPVELGGAEPGHYVATGMTVPYPGRWTLELAVRTSDIDEDVIRVPVQVR
ncbi:MAG TPA: copper resistance protein CopC [Solirubrobacter sp.]|nr:copper resistance protein CopC [Solirubrobacter sp.]